VSFYSMLDQKLQQRLQFNNGVLCLDLAGQLMVCTNRSVYLLRTVDWYSQVLALLSDNRPDDVLHVIKATFRHRQCNQHELDVSYLTHIFNLSTICYSEGATCAMALRFSVCSTRTLE
jgi:hypothetical protein